MPRSSRHYRDERVLGQVPPFMRALPRGPHRHVFVGGVVLRMSGMAVSSRIFGIRPFKSLRQPLNPHISRKLLTPFAKNLPHICRLFPRNPYPRIMQAKPCQSFETQTQIADPDSLIS